MLFIKKTLQSGKVHSGSLYIVVFLMILTTGAFILTGDMPSIRGSATGQEVIPQYTKIEGGKDNLQLYTFGGVTDSPQAPGSIPPPTPTTDLPPICPSTKIFEVMLIIDISGSTKGQARDRQREAAKYFADTLGQNPQNKLGLLVFDETANLLTGLTSDINAFKNQVDQIPDHGQSTCISCGIEPANSEIATHGRSGVTKIAVLLSDGNANRPKPNQEAERLTLQAVSQGHQQSQTIFYGLGFTDPGFFGFGHRINEPLMQAIANGTGGKYFAANSADELKKAFAQILNALTCTP